MGGGVRTEVGGVQGGPLTAGAQHVEDGVGTLSVRDTRPAPAKAVGVPVLGQQALEQGPQGIGYAESGRYFVYRRAPAPLTGLCHARTLSNLGYSDRH